MLIRPSRIPVKIQVGDQPLRTVGWVTEGQGTLADLLRAVADELEAPDEEPRDWTHA